MTTEDPPDSGPPGDPNASYPPPSYYAATLGLGDDLAPSGIEKIRSSIGFYLVTMTCLTFVGWMPYRLARKIPHLSTGLLVVGVTFTAFGVLVIVLRLVRGSVHDAERQVRYELTLPVNPSQRIRKHLHKNEEVLWENTLHGNVMIPRLLLAGGILVISIVFMMAYGGVGAIGLMMAVLYAVYVVAEWKYDRYAITDSRIVGIVGLLTKDANTLPREKLATLKVIRPWQATLLTWLRFTRVAYSTWIIETAAQVEVLGRIDHIPAGEFVEIVHSLTKPGGS